MNRKKKPVGSTRTTKVFLGKTSIRGFMFAWF